MNALFLRDWTSYLSIFSVFLRLLGLFILVPGFSHQTIPNAIKLLLALVVAFALMPILKGNLAPVPTQLGGMAVYAIRETLIGFSMGFIAYLTFEAIHLAAQFMGYQMGFGAIGLMDPITQSSVSVLVPLAGWIALMVFFFTNMHHYMLGLFIQSYEITKAIDLASFGAKGVIQLMVGTTAQLFVVAIKIAAPFTFLVLASNCAVGILSRLLPQMHMILFVFPVTILLGLCTLYLLVPDLIDFFENIMVQMGTNVLSLLKTI